MRKGDRVTLTVAALDGDGAGVGEVEVERGVRVHVAGALPGEEVKARIEHVSPHRPDAWAALEEIARPSPERVVPPCPGFGACGGCTLEHLAYSAQVAWKGAEVARAIAAAPALGAVPVEPCVPSPKPLGYRNREKLVYARGADAKREGRPVLGAYAPRSHRVIDLAGCRVVEPPLDEVARALLPILEARGVVPFDERLFEGTLRYVILRSNHLGQVLAILVTASADFPAGPEIAAALRAARPEVVGVVQNVNPSRGNVLFGPELRTLAGQPKIEEQVGPVRLELSPTAFFQVNRELAARLYADLAAAADLDGTERVVDVYSGVGGVALTLAGRAGEVIGIEENPQAVTDAAASAQLNHATRARFLAGDAAVRLGELDAADVIVLNPPRRGCDPEVLEAAARLRPRRLLYVSCAPDTLVRDLERLDRLGLRVRSLRPYDMLPETPHIEVLAVVTPT